MPSERAAAAFGGRVLFAVMLAGIASSDSVAEQTSGPPAWPRGVTRIIVPFAAGSTPDGLGRLLAERLQERFGTPFVVENKPGASGNIGTDAIAKAAPDGRTLGLSTVGPLVLNAILFRKLAYNTARDLAAITIVAQQPSILVSSNDSGLRDLKDVLARLSTDGASLNFGSIGYGSLSHLAMIALPKGTAALLQHIVYASSPAVLTALVRNDVQLAILPAGSVVPQARSNVLIMIASTGSSRSPLVPEVPTFSERGVEVPEASAWVGLIGPAGLPKDLQDRVRQAVLELLRESETRERLKSMFLEPVGSTGEEFLALMAAELLNWRPVIAGNAIRIE